MTTIFYTFYLIKILNTRNHAFYSFWKTEVIIRESELLHTKYEHQILQYCTQERILSGIKYFLSSHQYSLEEMMNRAVPERRVRWFIKPFHS